MFANRTTMTAVFYGGLSAVVLAILLQLLPMFLPAGVADRVGHNSEGMVLALIAAAWIQFVRPRLTGTSREWPVTAAVVVVCALAAGALLASDLPSRFRTLNETFLAAAVILPYFQLRRPLPRWLPVALSAAVLAVVVVFVRTTTVTDLAETLGVLILLPIGFDLVDRAILHPSAQDAASTRYAWYAFLVAAPITFSVLQYGIGFDGLFGEATRYAVRIAEAFLFMLLVELYFTVALRRPAAVPSTAGPSPEPSAA